MFFSIIVPVYNVEKYIDECLKSLINQTFEDFEIVIVDDGSTDSSGKICDDYASKDNRIKVIHKKNEGLLMARRTGLSECQGEYILHCDSDDYVSIKLLETVKNEIDNSHPDMVMFGYSVINDEHKILENHYDIFRDREFFSGKKREKLIKELSSATWLNNMWSKATKRECVDLDQDYSKYKSIKMGEDIFQVVSLVEKCESFVYLAEPLYLYRSNTSGMSKNIEVFYLDNHLTVADKMYKFLINEEVSEGTMTSFYNRYIKDIYKYAFRFLKSGMSKEEFEKMVHRIKADVVYLEAIKRYCNWSKENRVMHFFISKKMYYTSKLMAKTILSSKL